MEFALPDIEKAVFALVAQIPKGRVSTFQNIAIAMGDPIAARAVGSILAQHAHREDCACHRVVGRSGEVHPQQIAPLQAESIPVQNERVNLSPYLFRDFQSDRPLQRLQEIQNEIRQRMRLTPDRKEYQTVGGVDLSYVGKTGVAAYVRLDLPSLKILDLQTLAQAVRFPYIPSYLAFRELPVMLALLQKLKAHDALADITFVDGTGRLHHRQAGIASQLGVMLDIPTIGITKALLHGEPEKNLKNLAPGDVCYIRIAGQWAGAAIQPKGYTEPFFVSPGHRVDLEMALELSWICLKHAGWLPEPLQQAHHASRAAAQEIKRCAVARDKKEPGLFDNRAPEP